MIEAELKKSPIASDDFPLETRHIVEELLRNKILVEDGETDQKIIQRVRSKIPKPSVNVAYFILSEQCNLACRYCFLGNNNPDKRGLFKAEKMTLETAQLALDFFIQQVEQSDPERESSPPVIIFYGGEPILNFEALEYIAQNVNEIRSKRKSMEKAEMSVISNGTLLDREKIKRLNQLGVAIAVSVDGSDEFANSQRVDKNGKQIFGKLTGILEILREEQSNFSLSITLTEQTISNASGLISLIETYNVRSIGFNIIMSDEEFQPGDEYYSKASDFIIEMFIYLRSHGIYEDRIMRKLKSFVKSSIYFSDCAATSGSQVVITPDGSVGICHGCLADRKYFVTDINSRFRADQNSVYLDWCSLTPLNRDDCLACEALGICGGGCPINAERLHEGNTIHSLDERFCIHAKKTLSFLISDLYRVIKSPK